MSFNDVVDVVVVVVLVVIFFLLSFFFLLLWMIEPVGGHYSSIDILTDIKYLLTVLGTVSQNDSITWQRSVCFDL